MSQGDEGDTADRLDRIHPQAVYLADYAEFPAGGIGAPMIDRSAVGVSAWSSGKRRLQGRLVVRLGGL